MKQGERDKKTFWRTPGRADDGRCGDEPLANILKTFSPGKIFTQIPHAFIIGYLGRANTRSNVHAQLALVHMPNSSTNATRRLGCYNDFFVAVITLHRRNTWEWRLYLSGPGTRILNEQYPVGYSMVSRGMDTEET